MKALGPFSLAALASFALAPSPAAASGPPVISFEPGSARLSALAELQLDYAVRWLRETIPLLPGPSHINLESSADRVGSAAANVRLSRRRGEAVRAALVHRGFHPSSIAILAFGESGMLRIETADGVAEPMNRYVAVMIGSGPTPRNAEAVRAAATP
jgi:outer membrane protein OmpA-like peptidoglycan-associated protein